MVPLEPLCSCIEIILHQFYIIVGLELYLSTNDRVFQRPRFSSIVKNEKE